MRESRFYKRLNTDLACTVFTDDRELSGEVLNICEDGIGLELDYENCRGIDPGKDPKLSIQFVDSYTIGPDSYTDSILMQAMIVHAEDTGHSFRFGCKLFRNYKSELDYLSYVDRKKAGDFLRRLAYT